MSHRFLMCLAVIVIFFFVGWAFGGLLRRLWGR